MHKSIRTCLALIAGALTSAIFASSAQAQTAVSCPINFSNLRNALVQAQQNNTGGFKNNFWGVVVNREGVVCQVAYSGANAGSQWLLSRQIAAAKAFTANGLSLDIGTGTGALSTAQLYQFSLPANANVANPLYGLAGGNVLNSAAAFQGSYSTFGTAADPMIGSRVGGTITFGGGLALYTGNTVVGAIGLSGDTACADHSTAWVTRVILGLQPANPQDQLPFSRAGAQQPDGHPHCPNDTPTFGAR